MHMIQINFQQNLHVMISGLFYNILINLELKYVKIHRILKHKKVNKRSKWLYLPRKKSGNTLQ